MSASDTDKPILEAINFAGEISINGETAPITFRVSAGSDCRLRYDVDPVGAQTYLIAVRGESAPGKRIREFTLTGKSADGKTITSECVSVRARGSKNDGHWISLSSRACKVTLPVDRLVGKPILRLWFRSFLTFRNPVIETQLGRLAVGGEAKDVGPDDMSGSVTLEAPSHEPGHEWFEKANIFLRHMHRGLALANGGRLQTPRLDYIHGLTWEATFFEGAGFTPELPVQHHLNQGPFIKALTERYERAGPLSDILWTAIGWMQTDTNFDETRFLTAMTAVEAIIESELPERRGTIIPNLDFRRLRQKIKDLIAADDTLPNEAQEIFLGKVPQLNKRTFSQKIHALFDHYTIPKRDFEGNVIRDLVKLRNDIVHKGFVPNDADIWPSIILVRELITRILLKEIGFVGRYCCYVGGRDDRDFPGGAGDTA